MSLNDMASVPPINNTVNRIITTVDESMMLQPHLSAVRVLSRKTVYSNHMLSHGGAQVILRRTCPKMYVMWPTIGSSPEVDVMCMCVLVRVHVWY